VFLTHYFPPEVGAAQSRILRISAGLRQRGFEVLVHTGFPHYPDGRIPAPYANRVRAHDEIEGVPVLRTAVLPAPNRGVARRVAGHAVFALGAVATQRLAGPADVVVAESPTLFTGAAAVRYARRKRATLVFNVADRWPASAVAVGALRPGRAVSAAERLERFCYAAARLITVPTAPMGALLSALPSARGKVEVIRPGVELERFAPAADRAPRHDGPLRVLYAGTVGMAQGLDVLVGAARLVGAGVAEITIAGGGAELDKLRARVSRERIENVRLLGIVSADRVAGLYAEADAGAVLLRDTPIFDEALPTKLLETMAAGRPVLLSARGESASLVRRAEAGIVVPPGDAEALASAVRGLHADRAMVARLGEAGRRYVAAHYAADVQIERWAQLLSGLAGPRQSRRGAGGRRLAG
jgi:colanic acid biosynthesis glycosyl transferase WcaI